MTHHPVYLTSLSPYYDSEGVYSWTLDTDQIHTLGTTTIYDNTVCKNLPLPACGRIISADGQKHQEFLEKAELTRRKELADGAGLNCLCHKLIMGHASQLYLIALMAHSCHGMNSKKISFSNMALFPWTYPLTVMVVGRSSWCHTPYHTSKGDLFWYGTIMMLRNGPTGGPIP